MSGQSIMDRVTAAKHSIAGQGLAKTVCKATTEEVLGPKRKHLDYLLQCTNEPNVSIPQLADLLIERTQNSSWVIVFKALITIHNLMNYGNERFTQYLASNNCSFNLTSFIDKTGVQGYDMSTFIRRYARYLNEKAYTYRIMAFDFCKVKRGRDDGLLRTMNSEKLLKTLPALQKQIDALLEFDCTSNELNNGVINACFMLLFKDLIRLFACYNDGTINLLEKYFDMNKKHCKEALDIYKKFLVRMDKVSEFLKVAENVGIDKGDIPDLAKAPASLLDALEQHLASLEGKKGVPAAKPSGFNTAVNTMSGNSTIQISDEEKRKILDEESKHLEQLKDVTLRVEQKAKEQTSAGSPSQAPQTSTNPFASPSGASAAQSASPSKPSDDLLNLNDNPFSSSIQNVMQMNAATSAFGAPAWGPPASTAGFNNNFAQFPNGTGGSSNLTGWYPVMNPVTPAGFDAFGEILQPQSKTGATKTETKEQPKLSQKDLDSNLALLAGNISINGAESVKKSQHQWQPKGEQKKTGGNNWASPTMSTATTWTQPTFSQPANIRPMMGGYGQPVMSQAMMQPGMMPVGSMAPMGGMGMAPMGGVSMAPTMGGGMGPGMARGMAPMGQPVMFGAGIRPGMPPMGTMNQPPASSQPNDPFGLL